MLQNNPELKNKIDQLWNKFRAGGISNPLTWQRLPPNRSMNSAQSP